MEISPEMWNSILNGISILLLALLGKMGFRIVRETSDDVNKTYYDQTTRVVQRLDNIEKTLASHDAKFAEMAENTSKTHEVISEKLG